MPNHLEFCESCQTLPAAAESVVPGAPNSPLKEILVEENSSHKCSKLMLWRRELHQRIERQVRQR